MEAGLAVGGGGPEGAVGGGSEEEMEVEGKKPSTLLSPPRALSRKELLDILRQRNKRARSEKRLNSAERENTGKKRRQ